MTRRPVGLVDADGTEIAAGDRVELLRDAETMFGVVARAGGVGTVEHVTTSVLQGGPSVSVDLGCGTPVGFRADGGREVQALRVAT